MAATRRQAQRRSQSRQYRQQLLGADDLNGDVIGAGCKVLMEALSYLIGGAVGDTASTSSSLPGLATSLSRKPIRFQLLR